MSLDSREARTLDDWIEISVQSDDQHTEAVADVLRPFAYQETVAIEQLADMASEDPRALLPGSAVKIYVSVRTMDEQFRITIDEAVTGLVKRLGRPMKAEFRKLIGHDWSTAWRDHYQPLAIGERIWLRPSWQDGEAPAGRDIVILMDPGMAFGTGQHQTTRLCLELMENLVVPGDAVLDVGCGSGVLSIAAAMLGAERVLAIDNDKGASHAARENTVRNGVAEQIEVRTCSLGGVQLQPYGLVVANILAPVLTEMLLNQRLADYVAPNGRLILSGLLEAQKAMICETAAGVGLALERAATKDEWAALLFRHS